MLVCYSYAGTNMYLVKNERLSDRRFDVKLMRWHCTTFRMLGMELCEATTG